MDAASISVPIDLFWTGGWDSTFRLLDLLLLQGRSVQPHYVVDYERKSTDYELKAMTAIKQKLFSSYPASRKLLLPTIVAYRKQLKPNEVISCKWQHLHEETSVGKQYEWLSWYADERELYDLEICFVKKEVSSRLNLLLYSELTGCGHECRLSASYSHESLAIFKYFRFPIVHLTKNNMEQIAKEMGFFSLMTKTWFCHNPRKNGKPCENCKPCRIARQSGHAKVLPKTNVLRDKWLRFVVKWPKRRKKIARKFAKLFSSVDVDQDNQTF